MGKSDARRVELGRAYHKLGRHEEAWRELEAAMVLDVEDINAHLQRVRNFAPHIGNSKDRVVPENNPDFHLLFKS